jgi:hypothetical protein
MDGADTATGFLAAEIPDVITQLLMWHGVYNFILAVIGFVFVVMAPIITYTSYKWIHNQHHNLDSKWTWFSGNKIVTSCYYDAAYIFSFSIPVIMIIVGLFMMNIEWLQIWIAPKVWLIEYAAQLAK